MELARRLEIVEAENDELRARVAELEEMLFKPGSFVAPIEWRLTAYEERVFAALLGKEIATRPHIMSALYDRPGVDPAEEKIVDVMICKLRSKLKPFDIGIETLWGRGWRLDPRERARLRAASKPSEPAVSGERRSGS